MVRFGRLANALASGLALAAAVDARAQSLTSNTWSRQTPVFNYGSYAEPDQFSNLGWTSSCYDPGTRTVVLYEGYVNGSTHPYTIYSNSIWRWNTSANSVQLFKVNNWRFDGTQTTARPENSSDPTPPDRHQQMACRTNQLFLFGGLNNKIAGANGNHPADEWTLPTDASSPRWTQIANAGGPDPGKDANIWGSMVFDGNVGKFVQMKAPTTPYVDYRTWLFDPATNRWTGYDVNPSPSVGATGGNIMAYDSRRKRTWLFGAATSPYDTGGNELWKLNAATPAWTKVTANNAAPSARIYHGLVYNSKHDVLTLFGGSEGGDGGPAKNDTWVYQPSVNSWAKLNPPASPPGTTKADLSYDEANDVAALFTGQEASPQFWLFRYEPCGGYTTDPNAVLPLLSYGRPGDLDLDPRAPSTRVKDFNVGACFRRITDVSQDASEKAPTHIYSELQAWNADNTKMLLRNGDILDTATWAEVDHVPDGLYSARWSQTDPDLIISTSTYTGSGCSGGCAAISTYDLSSKQVRVLKYWPAYAKFNKDRSWQETSRNGEWMAMFACKTSNPGCDSGISYAHGDGQCFMYNLATGAETTPVACTVITNKGCDGSPGTNLPRRIDWAQASPNADYMILHWGYNDTTAGGATRYCGTEAYDHAGTFRGSVSDTNGHGSLTVDSNGDQWYVGVQSNDVTIFKYKIPAGHTNGGNEMVPLWRYQGSQSLHISCLNYGQDWCVVSTYWSGNGGVTLPFENEIFRLDLSSTTSAPVVRRLAHTWSDPQWVGPTCNNLPISYWTYPRASVRRDGQQVVFASSWGRTCRAESYVIDLVAGGGAPSTCGNGTVEAGESCDGTNLGGNTCQTLGYSGGTLACRADCGFDTSGCTGASPPPTVTGTRRTDTKPN